MKAGWVVRRLSEVTTKIGSGATPRGGNVSYKQEGLSLIRSLNVHDLNFRTKDLALIDDIQAEALSNVVVEPRDVLLNITGASIARCTVVPDEVLPARVNQHVSIIRPVPQKVDSNFLAYLLVSKDVKGRLLGIGDEGGSTRQALTKAQLQEFPISLPPLEEQQRIVAVLDEAFEGLARARAHAEANLQNARDLFESKRRALLTADSDAWTTKTLNEVCIVERGSSPRPIKNFVTDDDDGVNWVKIGDTKVGSKYVTGTKEKITKKGAEKSRAVYVGDFILTNSMTYGRPYIMGIDGYIHDGWFVLRLKDEIDSDFFFHLLSSTVVQDQFEQLAAGSVVKNISGDLVKKAVLSLPPVAVQTVIALELDSISGDVECIEMAYRDKLQDLDDLRQSLLQKAFAGELT